jgi:hypothetical protein
MKTFVRTVCAGLGLMVVILGSPLWGQVPASLTPSRRPFVSPYINILRAGADPAINYYGIVRPEIAFRNSISQLQQQQNTLATQEQDLATYMAVPPTGHTSGFMTHMTQSKYFMTGGARGTTGRVLPPVIPPQLKKSAARLKVGG